MPSATRKSGKTRESAKRRAPQPAAKKQEAGSAQQAERQPLGELIQHARQAPNSLTQRDVLQLQRTLGNRAVSQMLAGQRQESLPGRVAHMQSTVGVSASAAIIQRMNSKQKKGLKTAGIDDGLIKQLDEWQKARSLSEILMGSILRAGENDSAKLTSLLELSKAECDRAGDNTDEFYNIAEVKGKNKAMTESAAQATSAAAARDEHKPPIIKALNDRGIGDVEAQNFAARHQGTQAISQWLPTMTNDTILQKTIDASNKENKTLAELDQILVTHNTNRYAVMELLGLITSYGYDQVFAALPICNVDNNLEYLKLMLSYHVSNPPPQFEQLVRFQTRLRATRATLTVYKADVPYLGGRTANPRTGFLEYLFGGGNKMEIHTHWDAGDGKIQSMHVQDSGGANGIEMNQWSFFDDVANEVVAAHNRSTGTLAPTTIHPKGSLSR